MSAARHPRPPALIGIPEEAVAWLRSRKPDWNVFKDATIEGFKRRDARLQEP